MKRFRGRATDKPFGEPPEQMHRVVGEGLVVLRAAGRRFTVLELGGEAGYFREAVVFGFQEQVAFENGRVPSASGGLDLVHLRGRGRLVLVTRGEPVAVEVTQASPVHVPLAALVGWTGTLTPRIAPLFAGGADGDAVEISGEGRVLVDPGPTSAAGGGGVSARSLRAEALNLPNAITLIRMAMIPVILWFTYYESRRSSFIAAMLFAVIGATDFLDGWVARQRGLVTVIGKFLDPLADKLVVMAALVMLVHLGRVAAWVVIVIMGREFIVSGLRTIAMSEGIVISAGQEGKVKTIFQLIGITFLLLHYAYPIDFGFASYEYDANKVGTVLLYLSMVFSVWSAWVYFSDFLKAVYQPAGRP